MRTETVLCGYTVTASASSLQKSTVGEPSYIPLYPYENECGVGKVSNNPGAIPTPLHRPIDLTKTLPSFPEKSERAPQFAKKPTWTTTHHTPLQQANVPQRVDFPPSTTRPTELPNHKCGKRPRYRPEPRNPPYRSCPAYSPPPLYPAGIPHELKLHHPRSTESRSLPHPVHTLLPQVSYYTIAHEHPRETQTSTFLTRVRSPPLSAEAPAQVP